MTLTKAHVSHPVGTRLLSLLRDISADGELALGELNALTELLAAAKHDHSIPAIAFLAEEIETVMRDGKVTPSGRADILDAIERVLPLPERRLSKLQRERAKAQTSDDHDDEDLYGDEPSATERQLAYIAALGGTPDPSMSIGDASTLIDELKSRAPVSSRQIMVLRFWNRADLQDLGRTAVSQWIDEWYEADPRRRDAWEMFKAEAGDTGEQGDPTIVPLGAGYDCLKILTRI